jgi:aspartyl-tRNA(Asn)/glutamyl-tRNA(Gln) amidotransferase subunit C
LVRDNTPSKRKLRCKPLFFLHRTRRFRCHPVGWCAFVVPRLVFDPNFAMSLTRDDVYRIAHLARIEINEAQANATLAQLNDIFAMIEKMQRVNTEGIEPMSHPLGGSQRLRDDAVTETDQRNDNLRNAPAQADGLFLVPKVIE